MTMKPKARKFRIRRGDAATVNRDEAAAPSREIVPAAAEATPVESPALRERAKSIAARQTPVDPPEKTPAQTPAQTPEHPAEHVADQAPRHPGEQPSDPGADEHIPAASIDAIRREGLTGRQLRMARRVAQMHNLPATSDFDAVRQLRLAGIDPFKQSNLLELVIPRGDATYEDGDAPGEGDEYLPAPHQQPQLPQTVPVEQRETLPSTELSPRERRNREIADIQQDIMRRRRRKMLQLLARLSFFVFLPTLLAGYYYYVAATPMYSTKAEFLILQADNTGGSGLGGLLAGTQFATNQDAIAVQSYLESKDAMLRLDRDVGFKSHFTQAWIDPIQRLAPDASNEAAYAVYQKRVKIGYDPTEGVIKMEVVAADPEISAEFSRRLISYAEARVNNLSEEKREDQMRDAMRAFEKAETDRRAAQEDMVRLQQEGALLDPEGVIGSIRSQISNVEIQLQERQLELAALMDNARPNQAKVDGARGDIRRLEALLAQLNDKMTNASKGENSLANLAARIQIAQADLATRDLMLQSALQQVEQTRMEANRQVRYLTTSVVPVASQEASYPRSFENTILAFLIFSGVYLMISLTASILREQVTS